MMVINQYLNDIHTVNSVDRKFATYIIQMVCPQDVGGALHPSPLMCQHNADTADKTPPRPWIFFGGNNLISFPF